MNHIKYFIIIGLMFGFQTSASIGTTTSAVTNKPVASSATSSKATTKILPVATSSLLLPKISTSSIKTEASSTVEITPISTTTVATTSYSEDIPVVKTDENLAKLFGSMDPVSLDVASTSTTTDGSLLATDDDNLANNEAQQLGVVDIINQQAGVATSEPQGLIASFKYLSSNVVIKLLGSLALIFLLAAIIFLLLSKRYDRRDTHIDE